MGLITKEMKEKICTDKGNHILETRLMIDLMGEIRRTYKNVDTENMGVKFDDVYEVMLMSIYMKGFEDALNSIDVKIDTIAGKEI